MSLTGKTKENYKLLAPGKSGRARLRDLVAFKRFQVQCIVENLGILPKLFAQEGWLQTEIELYTFLLPKKKPVSYKRKGHPPRPAKFKSKNLANLVYMCLFFPSSQGPVASRLGDENVQVCYGS